MNKNYLKSKMQLKGDTNQTLAGFLGISPQRLSAKMNERFGAEFKQSEIEKIKVRYQLVPEELDEIFFNKKVS